MHIQTAKQLAAALERDRPTLEYFPHRYAAWLLGRAVGEGASVRALKLSAQARLLDNLLVRQVAARAAGGVLTRRDLDRPEAACRETYRIGLATWGPARAKDWYRGWYQTTRRGSNLVLLLCFPPQHDAAYRRLLDPAGRLPAVSPGHPQARAPHIALAWTRLDVDLAAGEALVEEVQSDWVRRIGRVFARCEDFDSEGDRDRMVQRYFANPRARFDGLARYWLRVLAHHRAWWAEAMLFAALWILVERLRVRRIYYHTYETGHVRKAIWGRRPPRSLYTDLPERFGFALTLQAPRLYGHGDGAPWYRLEL